MTEVSFEPLSPLSFLLRSGEVWRDREAVVDGSRTWTYAEHHRRVRMLSHGLRVHLGIKRGDRVALLMPNVSAALELHYAVPGCGAVLVPLNTRLAPADYAYILAHSGARLVFAHRELQPALEEALFALQDPPQVVWVEPDGGEATSEYERLLADGEEADLCRPRDERTLLSINYTSGTTGSPKGVMVSHRGAYLHSLGQIAEANLAADSRYLWTLPIFHCNGWCYTWAVTAAGATHHCVPQIDAAKLWTALRDEGVTHFCAAPAVLVILSEAAEAAPCPNPVRAFVGGSPPTPALLEQAAALNIEVTHLYGLTETYGPLMVCAWNPDWDARSGAEKARLRARQGVPTVVTERIRVVDQEMLDVPADGETSGEIVMRGNNVMLGYYEDEAATAEAFRDGWFHSGDLGVMHPDGYVELRDRLKDVIISGGENISTVEIERAVAEHPSVAEAAVVACPDDRWGEVPIVFVTLRAGATADPEEIREQAGGRLARFKVPRRVVIVEDLPKTGTGKVQKFILRERARELILGSSAS